jgi:hypothetical protein
MRASIAHLGTLKPASIVPLRGYFASTSAIVAACFMEGWWYECLSLASPNLVVGVHDDFEARALWGFEIN